MNKRAPKRIYTLSLCLSVIMAVVVSSNAFSQNTTVDYAGSIVYSVGDVVAVDAEGVTRPLGRRTDVYIGDTLYTGPESSAQLSMSDSAQIILRESTVFEITDYSFQSAENDSIVLDLIEGGFRTVTGSVAKERYRANVRGFSSIGIRGTEYEAYKTAADRLLIGIYDGGVTISNFGGDLDLGIDADFDFAEVQSSFLPPVGLEDMPVRLNELQFEVVAVPTDLLQNANTNLIAAIDSNLTQAGPDGGNSATGDFLNDVASLAGSDDEEPTGSDSLVPAGGANLSAADGQTVTNLGGDSATSSRNRRFARSQDIQAIDASVNLAGAITDAVDDSGVVEALVGESLDVVAELTELPVQAVLASLPTDLTPQVSALLAVVASTDTVLNTPDISAVFDTIESIESIASTPVTSAVESVESVTASTETVAGNVTAPLGSIIETVETAVVATGNLVGDPPTVDGVAMVTDSAGEAVTSVTDIAAEEVATVIDPVEEVVSTVTDPVEEVVATATDPVEEVVATVADPVEEVVATVTDPAEEVVATVTDPVEEVVATVTDPVEEVVATVTDPVEEVVAAATDPVEEIIAAVVEVVETVVAAAAAEPEPEEETAAATDPGFIGSLLALNKAPAVKRKDSVANVNWGAWNTPVPEHIASSMTISAGDYSVDLTPTPLDNLTGSYKYSDVTDYQGHGSAGNLTGLEAGFDVDFNTGLITNGILSVAVEDTQNWLLGFDGLIEQGVVDLNSLGGSLIEHSPLFNSVSPIDGDLSGAFAGQQAESFIGGFELLDLQNPLNTVEGIYTIER